MKTDFASLAKLSAGLLIIAALVYFIGPEKAAASFTGFDTLYLIPVAAIFLALLFLSGLNLKILFDARSSIGFLEFFREFSYSWAVGSLLPGKIGDFSLSYLLRKKIPAGESAAIIVIDKLITFAVLSLLGAVAVVLFLGKQDFAVVFFSLGGLWAAGLFLLFTETGKETIKGFLPEKMKGLFSGFTEAIGHFFRREKKRLAANLLITILKLGMQSLAFVLLFEGAGVKSGLIDIMLITAASTIFSLVPITAGGLGIKEASYAFLCLQIGIPAEKSFAASVISTVINYAIVGLIALLFLARAKHGGGKK